MRRSRCWGQPPLLFVLLIILTACGGSGSDAPATETRGAELTQVAGVVEGAAATSTRAAELTQVSDIIATRDAPTATPLPTATRPATATPSPTPWPTATVAVTEPTPSPTPVIFSIGDTVTWANGISVTLLTLERPFVPNYPEPDPGFHFVAIEVEQCAGPNVPANETVNSHPWDFTLVLADNTRYQEEYTDREPRYGPADLFAGECNRGWLTFLIPETAQLATLAFDGDAWSSADRRDVIGRWTLAQ